MFLNMLFTNLKQNLNFLLPFLSVARSFLVSDNILPLYTVGCLSEKWEHIFPNDYPESYSIWTEYEIFTIDLVIYIFSWC